MCLLLAPGPPDPAGGSSQTVTVVAASAVLLSPLANVQQSAGQAASAARVFLANPYFFLFTEGYFPDQTTSNPFLHTWSLSVEEQFYFVLPWLLVLGWYLARIARRGTLTILIVVAWVASFAANLMLTYHAIPR
jgi:peptidoglycan/LPS O-acetylase OafA/YrhL